MKNRKKRCRAAAPPASTARKGSAARQGALPAKIKHENGQERKTLPVPILVAFKRVRPDSQITGVIACLATTNGFVDMPMLSRRSGSLNVHSVIAQIRQRFRWVIENDKKRFGLPWHGKYRLANPAPISETP
jgi:hypothetical protein